MLACATIVTDSRGANFKVCLLCETMSHGLSDIIKE